MAKLFQWRRGTTAEHATFTGEEGEITVDTDKDTLIIHDGFTAGGFPLAREDMSNFANVWTVPQTINLTTDATALSIISTDDGAGSGPSILLRRNSASPAVNDNIGTIKFIGEDSAAGQDTYVSLEARILDETSTEEDGLLLLSTVVDGTLAVRARFGAGVQIGSPIGGDKGVGTLNIENELYLNGIQLNHTKNLIINGNFDIWQRGTSFSTFNIYTADRWRIGTATSPTTLAITREAFTIGQTDVPGEPEFYLRVDHDNNILIQHRIEGVRILAGNTGTFSFYAKADATTTLGFFGDQNFGSGGSTAVNIIMSPSSINLTTSWQKFTVVMTMASISGKTIGPGSHLAISISNTGNFVIDFAQAQIEEGSLATEFEKRPIGVELAMAQRFYQKTFPQSVTPAQNAGREGALTAIFDDTGAGGVMWHLGEVMRTSPTVVVYNPSFGAANWRNFDDSTNQAAQIITNVNNDRSVFITVTANATNANDRMEIQAGADAEL